MPVEVGRPLPLVLANAPVPNKVPTRSPLMSGPKDRIAMAPIPERKAPTRIAVDPERRLVHVVLKCRSDGATAASTLRTERTRRRCPPTLRLSSDRGQAPIAPNPSDASTAGAY